MNILNAIYPVALPITLALVGYDALLTGLLVFFKRRDQAGLQYFISSFAIFVWGAGLSFMLNNDLPTEVSHFWGKVSQMSALFIPVTWLHFVLVYTRQFEKQKIWLYLSYLATFAIFPLTWTKWYVAGFHQIIQVNHYPIPGPLYVAFTILFAIVVIYSFSILYRVWKNEKLAEKKQDYKFLAFAQLFGFTTGSLSFLPVYGIPFPQYNLLIMPLWQFLLAYAMVRYQLMGVEEMAQAAHRDKLASIGTLATSINHEIRNPLYLIQGLAESHLENLKENVYGSGEEALQKSKQVLVKSAEQAKRAMEIMKNFAMFAKQGMNNEPNIEEVKLNKTMAGILPLIQHELEMDKIELAQNISEQLQPFKADQRHVEQILFNLIVNACQALKAEAGSQKLEAREKQKDPQSSFQPPTSSFSKGLIEISAERQNGHINIMVKDNGPGIPEEQIKKIFEPFFTTKQEGTGLGLYITKQLVERNGGKISVRSTLGQGTTFYLEFKR